MAVGGSSSSTAPVQATSAMFRQLNLFRGEACTAPNDNLFGGEACTAPNDTLGHNSRGEIAPHRSLVAQKPSPTPEETEQIFHDAEESEQTFYDALDYWNEPDSMMTTAMINVMDYSRAVKGEET